MSAVAPGANGSTSSDTGSEVTGVSTGSAVLGSTDMGSEVVLFCDCVPPHEEVANTISSVCFIGISQSIIGHVEAGASGTDENRSYFGARQVYGDKRHT